MIYVNGDSHSHGVNIPKELRYSNIVADYFGLPLINESQIGASNQYILRTSQNFLDNNKPGLVIIGWTTWEREEWEFNGQFYNVNSSGHDQLPAELELKYKNWVLKQDSKTLATKSQYWHDKIWHFHQSLSNIPHVFFNCMYNFFGVNDEHNWNNKFVGPYNNSLSYYWYLKNCGYQADDWYHYGTDGHARWAKLLIDHIKQHNLL